MVSNSTRRSRSKILKIFIGKIYARIKGKIRIDASLLTGLREGTPIASGAGDQAEGAVGNGIV